MKRIYYLLFLLPLFFGCHDMDEGFLIVENAEYLQDSLVIRKIANLTEDRNRLENQSPWVTDKIDGVLGTEPIVYSLYEVKAYDGGNARIFSKKDLTVRGVGKMEVQLYPEAPRGRYVVSLQVSAGDHTAILEDIFKFIIE